MRVQRSFAPWPSASSPESMQLVSPRPTATDRRALISWLRRLTRALSFHDLRHTGATLAAASGAPLRALMHRMGQNSAAAAIRYQHVLDGQDVAIAAYLDGLVKKG